MGTKTILFLLAFVAACGGALYTPLIGVIAYMMHYQIGPERQWWTESIRHWGIRYSFVLAACTGVAVAIHWRKLRYGKQLLIGHEWLLILFVGVVWLSAIVGLPVEGDIDLMDYPPLKLSKVVLFCLMMTHVVTTPKDLRILSWAFVVGALFLGYQAFTAPDWMFTSGGRLDDIGGPDFAEANGLAAYLLATLPIIGVHFMRSGWSGKLLCLASGVLAVNAIVLTRSRGATMGAACTLVVALMIAPKALRKAAVAGVILAAIGAYALTDAGFWERASTTTASEEERDRSAQSRIEIWEGSLAMLKDYWYGVGAGNFQAVIGKYSPQNPNRDSHNTYVRCYSELGIQGMAVFAVLILSAAHVLWRAHRQSLDLPAPQRAYMIWMIYAFILSMSGFLVCGITMTLLYTEALYWLLAVPVCLWRSAQNLAVDPAHSLVAEIGNPSRPSTRQPSSSATL